MQMFVYYLAPADIDRGIVPSAPMPGWYAGPEDGTVCNGPFDSRADAIKAWPDAKVLD